MKFMKFFVLFIVLSSNCFSNENSPGFDLGSLTNIYSVKIFIYTSNGPYSIYGGLDSQIEYLENYSGVIIDINSLRHVIEYEKELKLETFVPVKNYDKFIEEFETYVMFKVEMKSGNIILACDGEYLLNVTDKKYRKIDEKFLLNFNQFG